MELKCDSNIVINTPTNEASFGKKYKSLTKDEVNQLTTYTRKSFFRRCKFVNSGIIHGHMDKFFDHIMVHDKGKKLRKHSM
jgi:hypothetical protein